MRHGVPGTVTRLFDAVPDVAMLAYDRHLDVVAATAKAQALHPIYRPGTNIARFAFLDGAIDDDLDDRDQKIEFIAATLKSSLERHPEDADFLNLIGTLTAGSRRFAEAWPDAVEKPDEIVVLIRHRDAGILRLNQVRLPIGVGSEVTLTVWTGADDESSRKLAALPVPAVAGGSRS